MPLKAEMLKSNVQASSDGLQTLSTHGRRQKDVGKGKAERKGNQTLSCYQKATAETTNTSY